MNRVSLFLCFALTVVAGCDRGGVKVASNAPKLPVAKPIQAEVTDYVDYTGRTNAKDAVTIIPRVTGYLVTDDKEGRMEFKEGDFVEKDKVLFKIDPRPYKAQLDAALAAEAQNVAGLKYAKETNLRYKDIAKKQPDAVSPRELDQFQAQEEQAIANLNLAKANLEAARLNLEWTTVRSPIGGQISRYFLTAGNLVNQDVTQLTTVVSMEEMYVYFDMDEPTYLQITKGINEGRIARPNASGETLQGFAASTIGLLATPFSRGPFQASASLYPGRTGADMQVLMELQGETDFPHKGIINFTDNQVNPGTGSISFRGVFKNPRPPGGSYLLKPGMFVRVRMPIGQPQKGLLVIDSAIVSEQGQKKIYVVDSENKVQDRPVSLGSLQKDGLRVVTQGLQADDWVLIGGLQQVRPRMVIEPDRWQKMPTQIEPGTPSEPDKSKGKGKK